MKDNFSIVYETLHVDGSRGELENALKISPEHFAKRQVVIIDIANDPLDSPKDSPPEEDPAKFKSERTGRGPLNTKDWIKTCDPVMTCYKLVYIEFKWFGLQNKVESFIAKTIRNVFQKFHRQLFSLTDRWYGMTMQDIRDLEDKTKEELDVARANQDKVVGGY
ncbi:phosphatidylinositol transfer protein alpha isoform-like protein [Jimgerdemannia flammicorona]|uniref:Phosphatidylinositol transfer protein alpha isoform-like protein n=1 Tax=Jimgerdemannia flammicorona TaxID=994334 RepID=A0A433QDC3_9FUNG|nr:phosphatidylinositol transfer protein alpha isoform-like protein [Jimgerdemannia flammicorona]